MPQQVRKAQLQHDYRVLWLEAALQQTAATAHPAHVLRPVACHVAVLECCGTASGRYVAGHSQQEQRGKVQRCGRHVFAADEVHTCKAMSHVKMDSLT